MQLNNLKRLHKNKRSVAVGRGGKRGKTSGRGTKGQKARAGRKIRPEMRDVIKRLPKLSGRGSNSLKSLKRKKEIVSVETLEKFFEQGDEVTAVKFAEKGIIRKSRGSIGCVKILGDGRITKALTIKGLSVSAGAKEKIEKAGGQIK